MLVTQNSKRKNCISRRKQEIILNELQHLIYSSFLLKQTLSFCTELEFEPSCKKTQFLHNSSIKSSSKPYCFPKHSLQKDRNKQHIMAISTSIRVKQMRKTGVCLKMFMLDNLFQVDCHAFNLCQNATLDMTSGTVFKFKL